jgi:hypothetical protein
MERGAERFFAELPRPDRRIGPPAEQVRAMTAVRSSRSRPIRGRRSTAC